MALWRFYNRLALFLGSRRRFVRRVGGMCLVFLGVHAAAGVIEDAVYQLVDVADLVLDGLSHDALMWFASVGTFTPEEARHHAERFAAILDLAEKGWLSLRLALVAEVVIDLLLLDFAWGTRAVMNTASIRQALKESTQEMVSAFKHPDIERAAVLPTMFLLSLVGAVVASVALESVVADGISRAAPKYEFTSLVAAVCGLLACAVLTWRFIPDLLHGALLRARQRTDEAMAALKESRAAQEKRTGKPPPPLSVVRILWTVRARGLWILVVALPLAVTSLLVRTDFLALIHRLGADG